MRDDSRSAPQVLDHLQAENAYTEAVLAPLASVENTLYGELTARLKPDDASAPVLHRGYWYYARYEPGREYPVHARRAASMEAPEEVLLDGNALAQGHEYFEIGDYAVSPDGRLLAYSLDTVGRRQYRIHVRSLADGRALPDQVDNAEAEILWSGDSTTLVYIAKDPQTLLSVRVQAHVLGTDPAQDRLVYEEADHSYYLGLDRSRSEELLFICCASTQQTEWHYARADDPALRFTCVLPREADHEYEVEQLDADFIIRSNWEAPNFCILRTPIAGSDDKANWRTVLEHREDALVETYEVARDFLAVNERSGGLLRIRVRSWGAGPDAGADCMVDASEAAFVMDLVHTPGITSTSLRYVYSSLTTPRSTFDFFPATGERVLRKAETVLGGFDASRYASDYLWAPARDGARIPVSVAWRRGTPRDGSAPLYLYGYGAYGISMDPAFRSSWISLMDRGFVVAIAHVRGGQELGRAWYEAGRLQYKMNSFTDFIDATDLLVREGYAHADRVCAQGGSAGGLLMGAVANLAPARYRAIVAHVPFVDVVTTMLDESIPLTTNEFDQWGDPREAADYAWMLAYSPYDQVRAQDYPALLVFTGLWDSQVQYFEPAKWVARLREKNTGKRPILFSIDMSAGHGGKSGRFQRYRDTAREYAFLLWQLGMVETRLA